MHTIPRTARSNVNHRNDVVPGWNEFVAPIRDKSILWQDIWVECGRPHDGVVASIMRRTEASYHYAVRYAKKQTNLIFFVSALPGVQHIYVVGACLSILTIRSSWRLVLSIFARRIAHAADKVSFHLLSEQLERHCNMCMFNFDIRVTSIVSSRA
jgi:hypothetical protein